MYFLGWDSVYTVDDAVTVLSVNYYDTYAFLGRNGIPDDTTTAYIETSGYAGVTVAAAKGGRPAKSPTA